MLELLQPWAILVPAFIAGIVLFLSWQAWRRDQAAANGYWGGAAGLAAGYTVGHVMMAGKYPAFPPIDAINDWVPYVGLIAMQHGLLEAFRRVSPLLRHLMRVVIILTALWFLLHPLLQGSWSIREGIQWMMVLGLGWFLFWSMMESLAERTEGVILPVTLWLLASGSAFVLLFSDSALLGKLSGVLAGMLGAVIVLTLWNRSITLARGGIAVLTCLLWTLWSNGFAYAELSVERFALLAAVPVLLWIGQMKPIRELRAWQAFVIQVGMPALLIGITVFFAYQTYEPMGDYY